jgi:hypothetical protein
MNIDNALDRLREFVSCFDRVRDVQFEHPDTVPYSLDSDEGIAYLLIVASVNQGTAAEQVRDFVRNLYEELGDDLLRFYQLSDASKEQALTILKPVNWKISSELSQILNSVTQLIQKTQQYGGLVHRGRQQTHAVSAVDKLATNISWMGKKPTSARKKAWMFMRWMVRPYPDIGVWNPPITTADLRIPLDVNTGKAFTDLHAKTPLRQRIQDEGITFERDRDAFASTAHNVESVTAIARWLFPNDPARVDYAFFCYGRRFGFGEDKHRCWKIVGCYQCSIKELMNCSGKI